MNYTDNLSKFSEINRNNFSYLKYLAAIITFCICIIAVAIVIPNVQIELFKGILIICTLIFVLIIILVISYRKSDMTKEYCNFLYGTTLFNLVQRKQYLQDTKYSIQELKEKERIEKKINVLDENIKDLKILIARL